MDDRDLISLFFRRDESAIQKTSEKYGHYCFTVAWNILFDREDSEECVNDTWYSAWNAIPPSRPSHFRAYLAKVTRNLSLNARAKESAKKRGSGAVDSCMEELEDVLPGTIGSCEEAVDELALGKILSAFLREQSETARKVFIQRYFYFESVKTIAKDSSLSESGVKMSLRRTRKALKDVLIREGISL